MADRLVQPRRTLEQLKQCVEAALSVVENKEDMRCAVDDLEQAQMLLEHVLPTLRQVAKGWARGAATK